LRFRLRVRIHDDSECGCGVYLVRAKQTSYWKKSRAEKTGNLEETLAEVTKCGIPYGHRALLLSREVNPR
jgi:hypothetical protein